MYWISKKLFFEPWLVSEVLKLVFCRFARPHFSVFLEFFLCQDVAIRRIRISSICKKELGAYLRGRLHPPFLPCCHFSKTWTRAELDECRGFYRQIFSLHFQRSSHDFVILAPFLAVWWHFWIAFSLLPDCRTDFSE